MKLMKTETNISVRLERGAKLESSSTFCWSKLQNKQNFCTFTSIPFWIQGFYLYLGWHLCFYLQPNSSTIRAENSWAADVHEARRTLTKLGCKWELSSVYWPSALLPLNSDWPLKPHMFPSVEVRTSFTHFLNFTWKHFTEKTQITLRRLLLHDFCLFNSSSSQVQSETQTAVSDTNQLYCQVYSSTLKPDDLCKLQTSLTVDLCPLTHGEVSRPCFAFCSFKNFNNLWERLSGEQREQILTTREHSLHSFTKKLNKQFGKWWFLININKIFLLKSAHLSSQMWRGFFSFLFPCCVTFRTLYLNF